MCVFIHVSIVFMLKSIMYINALFFDRQAKLDQPNIYHASHCDLSQVSKKHYKWLKLVYTLKAIMLFNGTNNYWYCQLHVFLQAYHYDMDNLKPSILRCIDYKYFLPHLLTIHVFNRYCYFMCSIGLRISICLSTHTCPIIKLPLRDC